MQAKRDARCEIKTMQARHGKEPTVLKLEARQIVKALMRVNDLCPYVKGLLKWENYCKNEGGRDRYLRCSLTDIQENCIQ